MSTRQLEVRLIQGPLWEAHGLVFFIYIGRPLGYRRVTRDYKALLLRSGLPEIRFHDLRHMAASIMLTGRPLHEVLRVLGHASITLTANTYRHVRPGEGAAAAAHMESLLGKIRAREQSVFSGAPRRLPSHRPYYPVCRR